MKVKGQVIGCAERGQIIIETTDGRRFKMPRMSANKQMGDGSVEFESIFAEKIKRNHEQD